MKLPGPGFCYTGMHDHMATAFTADWLAHSQNQNAIINATGTTESIMRIGKRKEELVRAAPRYQFNTESSWDRELLGLVGYSSPSGKILQAVKAIDLYEPQGWGIVEPRFLVYPPRKRLHEANTGKIVIKTPELREIDLLSFCRSLVLSTQFEVRRLIEDLKS